MKPLEKPKIIIKGEEKEVGRITARLGADIIKSVKYFSKETPTVDFVDCVCKILAQAFGVSEDDILELDISEIVGVHLDLYAYTIALLFIATQNLGEEEQAG